MWYLNIQDVSPFPYVPWVDQIVLAKATLVVTVASVMLTQ
jgi:hypothetical protein